MRMGIPQDEKPSSRHFHFRFRHITKLTDFKRELKTHLFRKAFKHVNWLWWMCCNCVDRIILWTFCCFILIVFVGLYNSFCIPFMCSFYFLSSMYVCVFRFSIFCNPIIVSSTNHRAIPWTVLSGPTWVELWPAPKHFCLVGKFTWRTRFFREDVMNYWENSFQ